mgnify:CR=1 FL=1
MVVKRKKPLEEEHREESTQHQLPERHLGPPGRLVGHHEPAQGCAHDQANADNALSGALRQLFALGEAYPDLKANQNFRDLQTQLEGTENRIATERHRYNELARDFNTTRRAFPTIFIANLFEI